MKQFFAICLLLLYSGSVLAEKEHKTYLCAPEVAGGFAFNEATKSWKVTSVNTNDKYVVKLGDSRFPKATATVTPFGKEKPVYLCSKGDSTFGSTHACHQIFGQFFFNRNTSRYIVTSMGSYIDGRDEDTGFPSFVEGGTCSPL